MENATTTLRDVAGQAVHAPNKYGITIRSAFDYGRSSRLSLLDYLASIVISIVISIIILEDMTFTR